MYHGMYLETKGHSTSVCSFFYQVGSEDQTEVP